MVQALSSEPVVACQSLTKVFKDFWLRARVRAVDDVTFQIERGEVFGLLGPNGSGKSTTIKILLGLLHKTSGRVAVFGKQPSDVANKRRLGYLPEESYLYAFLNARETLDYYGKLFELDRRTRTRRIDELLDMVGLTAVQFRPVHEYSKGMQRRIGIAQALINDPELLILDEPTTGLDPIGSKQIKDLIMELGRRGKSVLLSSHLLTDVEDCVDRMVILYGGKIRDQGTCESLLTTSDRAVIETDALDVETISQIDRLIRQRTGGAASILRVTKPRQRLEDLFIQIVERARAERVETAGAQHGGATAAFLRGDEEGESLIRRLVEEGEKPEQGRVPETVRDAAPPAPAPTEPDRDVLGELLGRMPDGSEPARPAAPKPAPDGARRPGPPADVDRGVIGSLLGDEEDAGADEGKGKQGPRP